MKAALLLASMLVVSLSGCLEGIPLLGDHSRLVVRVLDSATVHGDADPAANFGPRCPDFAYLSETSGELGSSRHRGGSASSSAGEDEQGPPELRLAGDRDDAHGAVVRSYRLQQDQTGGVSSAGPVGRDLVEFDDGSTMSLLSPFLTGPHLARIEIRGDRVVVDDEPLAPGERAHITRTYEVAQEGGSFHVEERITVENVGRVATRYVHELECDDT